MNTTHERILEWAQTQGSEFTSASAYKELDFVSDVKEMADKIRQLYIAGYLARKKIDKFRYSYIHVDFAPSDFDRCSPPKEAVNPQPVTSVSSVSSVSSSSIPTEQPEETKSKEAKVVTVSPLTIQEGGSHYKDMSIQPVEYIHKNGIGYFEGNVIKYVTRWRKKNGIDDLKKARHYIDLLIELEGSNHHG